MAAGMQPGAGLWLAGLAGRGAGGMNSIEDFEGVWKISRAILGRGGRVAARFAGGARISCRTGAGGHRLYEERGELALESGQALRAERRYLWRPDGGDIHVSFMDGSPFHRIELGHGGGGDVYECPPDLYKIMYVFPGWPVWTCRVEVSGPRKSHRIESRYLFHHGAP